MTEPTPRLRCTVVQPFATVAGAELWLLRLLDATQRLDVDVVLMEDGPLEQELVQRGVPVTVRPTGTDGRAIATGIRDLYRELRSGDQDVVLANGVKAAAVAVPAARLAGTPVLWMKHDFAHDARLARPLAALSDGVAANSDAVAEATRRKDAVIIPVPKPVGEPATEAAARAFWEQRGLRFDDGPVVAVLGRLNPFKGMDTAVRALAQPGGQGWQLALVGGEDLAIGAGETQRLRDLAVECGVDDRVHLLGQVQDAARWLAAFQAVAVVTRRDTRTRLGAEAGYGREGYSLVALEALAAGVPLIGAQDSPEVKRMATTAGVVVDAERPDEVAQALASLRDEHRRRALGAAGRELVRQHPDDAQIAERLVQVLAETAGRPGAGLTGGPVTVVTTMRNEEGAVDQLLGALVPQLAEHDEYLVVDDGSEDGTRAELEAWVSREPRLRLLDGPRVNAAAARNAAIAVAQHPVVATTDAGCLPGPGWLAALRAPFAEPRPPDLVTGVYSVPGRPGLGAAFALTAFPVVSEARRRTPWRRLHGLVFGRRFDAGRLDTRSMAVTTEAWAAVGGFDVTSTSAEDAVFGNAVVRSGRRAVLSLDAVVAWEQADLQAMLRMYYRYGVGGGEARATGLVAKDLARVAAYATAAGLLGRGGPGGRALVAAGAAAYLSVPAARALREQAGVGTVLGMPVAIVVKDLAKAAGCLVGLGRSGRAQAHPRPSAPSAVGGRP